VIKEHHVRFVNIYPWVSSVSGGLRLQNTQNARRAIDLLLSIAEHHITLGARSRTSEQRRRRSTRRVRLSAVLTQAASAAVRDRTARR
jgi:hypothetical protein